MQDFERLADHNAGSWFGEERLDKPCRGDIREIVPRSDTHSREPGPQAGDLVFDGEPIQIK
jgi:hypothetical protein